MKRRKFLATAATLGGAAALVPNARAAGPDGTAIALSPEKSKLVPPRGGSIPVAILISAGLNVIDFSGPWGVFESVSVPDMNEPFRLFTVAESADIVVSGSGLKLLPHYTFANVPEVKVVVIPAQRGSDTMRDWLRKIAPAADVTMSVCTGAFHLAKAGLLSGKTATTHHEFLDKLERQFPEITVKRGVRRKVGQRFHQLRGRRSAASLPIVTRSGRDQNGSPAGVLSSANGQRRFLFDRCDHSRGV